MIEWNARTLAQFIADCSVQRSVYEKMLALAKEQDALIASENMDGLLKLVAEKQALLRQVADIDARSVEFRAGWKEARANLSPEVIDRVERSVAQVEEVLRRLVQQEQATSALAGDARTRAGEALRQGTVAKRAAGAYVARPEPGDPRFIDKTE